MFGFLNVYKPKGKTSHDVVAILRRVTKVRQIGHTGTLDPFAEGVLPICIGKATRLIEYLGDDKAYVGMVQLGASTTTYDIEGDVVKSSDLSVTLEQIEAALEGFRGEIEQMPPIYSAIKVGGKKLYEYARNGEEVEIKERDIEIMMIELIDFSNNEIVFDVKCSKGTYIRSLCVDIAKKLGYPGHMSHLERRQAGRFLITDCITLEQLENDDYSLHSIDDALCGFPQLKLDDPTPVYHGKQIKSDLTGQVAIYDNQNRLLAIYESTGQGYLKNVRGLW